MSTSFFRGLRRCQNTVLYTFRTDYLYAGRIHLYKAMATSTDKINFDFVKEKLAKGEVTVIDVRELPELTYHGKIPGSIHIPLGQLETAFKLPPVKFESKYGIVKPNLSSDKLILSCTSGKRAFIGSITLKSMGYQNTKIYSGSYQDWIEKGGDFEKVKRITSLEIL